MGKQNEKLLKNIEEYDKKEKAEQQKSKVRRKKPSGSVSGKKTRMYHN